MISDVSAKDLAIVVLSCDKYSDLWMPFTRMFDHFWPACPFKKYIFSNEKKSNFPGFNSILSGPDVDWTSSLLSCLNQISERYIMILFDDAILSKSITAGTENKLISILNKYQPDYFRFRPFPQPSQWLESEIGFFKIDEVYRTALYAVWDKEVLSQILRPGEAAWQFELESVPRSAAFKNFLGTNFDFMPHVHCVEKGKWFRSAVKFLKTYNINLDLNYRPQMTRMEDLHSRLRRFRGDIYIFVPPALQKALIRFSQFIRKNIWSKW